jgi:hypothetical protein
MNIPLPKNITQMKKWTAPKGRLSQNVIKCDLNENVHVFDGFFDH